MVDGKHLVLIVEDDTEMAELNARLLKRNGFEVYVAHDIAGARALFGKFAFDLIVLDVGLPDGDGVSLCREYRRQADTPVMFLTGRSETADKITGLGAGGDYYLTKPYDRNEFVAVAQSLVRRAEQTKKKITEASVIKRGPLTLKLIENRAYVNETDIELTAKEFSVLLLLVQNERKELTAEKIYEAIWGSVMGIDTGLVRKTVSQIRRKLEIDEMKEYFIQTKYGGGYTFTDE